MAFNLLSKNLSDREWHTFVVYLFFCFVFAWYFFATWHNSMWQNLKASGSCQTCKSWQTSNTSYPHFSFILWLQFSWPVHFLCIFLYSCHKSVWSFQHCNLSDHVTHWFPHVFVLLQTWCVACVEKLFLELVCLWAQVCCCLLLPLPLEMRCLNLLAQALYLWFFYHFPLPLCSIAVSLERWVSHVSSLQLVFAVHSSMNTKRATKLYHSETFWW